ncbi:hypothetical protein ACSFA3_11525 [Variovorax sp. RHLX14]|uniref:hypothetical protein n=1 Tax=Variovorax sp. RHLX14 TaxID=1259731 RepID=UPI003F47EE76
MLISPPFLPALRAGESDIDWVARAMPVPIDCAAGTYAPEGSFPVSSYMQWHNGVHCTAPHEDGKHLLVRAIADGTVVFVASPVPANKDPAHPQNYPPQAQNRASWTDNGCVAIRHTTDIGAAGGVPTRITYFSLSMHLRTIADGPSDAKGKSAPWKPGDRIFRKDTIGEPGEIMGVEGQLHFEICCDEANLEKIIGRPVRWEEDEKFAALKADGRTDAVFGSVFIYLPKSTPTSVTEPSDPVRRPTGTQLGAERWVEIRYDSGSSYIASRDALGKVVGTVPFAPVKTVDFEYDMYRQATDRHAAYVAKGGSLPSSPSGWYELLRFGRNLGPDPLPADAAHWREIPASNGSIWVDLNAKDTFKFSEADFLPVMGWNCFGDDPTPEDQRCDSVELKRLIRDRDPENETRMTREALCKRIAKDFVREKLRRVICKVPTEWDRSTVAKRYGWIRDPKEDLGMDDQGQWDRFMRHCDAITFSDLPDELRKANWRFHPVEFIGVMRKCGWLSIDELSQLVPTAALRFGKSKTTGVIGHLWEPISTRSLSPQNRLLINHQVSLNKTTRKYGIVSRMRQASFFGNSIQETSWFGAPVETGGSTYWYSPWYGRGFLQLTHPGNYFMYWQWRGRLVPASLSTALASASKLEAAKRPSNRSNVAMSDVNFPALTQEIINWRSQVEGRSSSAGDTEAYHAPSDSAGCYWISLKTNAYADKPHILERVQVATVNGAGTKTYYRSQSFWQSSAAVNLPSAISQTNFVGLNGFEARCSAYGWALKILTEFRFPDANGNAKFITPE